ncbi:TMV resistance protein N-like [Quercus lobata]|uniref:ADP-ribosyl cyclase/cyclic ADP-ribose hydrolase n=1 Tax=Quercus lobata TaxID=97700 RepID=A0A7N2MWW2_QUELO|nr:TMV resistance protein N-like [Quercus lobata]
MTFQFQGPFSSSSSSSNSIITHRCTYDVFLSFRGKDTRYNFTGDLYNALHKKGINTTFIDGDDDELKTKREEEISQSLVKSIEGSRTSVVVLSRNYASSTWCLDQLVKILECKQTKGQVVLPVFWKVGPSDVRHQRKNFGKALTQLEDNTKVQSSKTALKDVANLSGWHIARGKGNESKFIQEIVQTVSIIVKCTYLNVANHPVGIESRVQDINSLLSIGRNDIRMVGILGVGGIGKTTIAKAIYNLIAHQFEGSCFLTNIREHSKQEFGLVQLQETLLSEILRDARSSKVSNVDRGINVIKNRLCSKRVLLILDDVDHLSQLEALAGKCDWFGLGSRIIITTRDKSLLTNHEVNFIYQVKEMDHNEALQLFSWNAFKRDKPTEEYVELTECAIHYAGGLPLALMVLGSDLYGKSMIQWKSALDKYARVPNKNIQEILKISYDGLDENEKDIFLDIACFFKGKHADYVIKILDGCGFFPDIGIQVLIDKSLVTIDEKKKLGMHDLLQDMGKEIVRRESPEEPSGRSRLWFHEDVRHVLEENKGTNKIEGILVDLPKREMINLSSKNFMKMKRLRLFINRNALFSEGPNYLSNELRLLEWPEYPLQYLPSNFHGKRLVVLNMRNYLFKGLHNGFKNLQNLAIMNFSNCEFITKVPDLSMMPNLEELNLENCTDLVEVHYSVGLLDRLRLMKFVECPNLRSFPRSLKLRSLELLMLEGCSGLENFPEIDCKMERLEYIGLRSTPIKELPSSVGYLIGLKELNLDGCENLMNLPISIHQLQRLKRLFLRDCSKLVIHSMPLIESTKEPGISSSAELSITNDDYSSIVFPEMRLLDIGNCGLSDSDFFMTLDCFSRLEQLDLAGSDFVSLPSCIGGFVGLRSLKLDDCKKLQDIQVLPPKMEDVYASGCISLERFSEVSKRLQFNTCELPALEWIDLSRCHKLVQNIGNDADNPLLSEGHQLSMIFPGNKIPHWFSHRKENSSSNICEIDINEPSNVDGEIIRMALCAVIGLRDAKVPSRILCSINIISNGLPIYGDDKAFHLSNSDHVWLRYYVPEHNELKGDKLQVRFWCSTKSVSFTSCGAHLVRKYEEKPKDCIVLNEHNDLMNDIQPTKRRRNDDGDGSNLESNLYPLVPQQKRCPSTMNFIVSDD